MEDIRYINLITALLTVGLLFFFLLVLFFLSKKLKESNERIRAYRHVVSYSSHYRARRFYMQEGLQVMYDDEKYMKITEPKWFRNEYKYVFSNLQEMNPRVPLDKLYEWMKDYYNCNKNELKEILEENETYSVRSL